MAWQNLIADQHKNIHTNYCKLDYLVSTKFWQILNTLAEISIQTYKIIFDCELVSNIIICASKSPRDKISQIELEWH